MPKFRSETPQAPPHGTPTHHMCVCHYATRVVKSPPCCIIGSAFEENNAPTMHIFFSQCAVNDTGCGVTRRQLSIQHACAFPGADCPTGPNRFDGEDDLTTTIPPRQSRAHGKSGWLALWKSCPGGPCNHAPGARAPNTFWCIQNWRR